MVKELFYLSPSAQMLSLQAGVFGSKCQGGIARSGWEQGRDQSLVGWEDNFGFNCSFTMWDISPRDYKETEKEVKETFTNVIRHNKKDLSLEYLLQAQLEKEQTSSCIIPQ